MASIDELVEEKVEWWEPEPVFKMHYQVTLEDGRRLELFFACCSDRPELFDFLAWNHKLRGLRRRLQGNMDLNVFDISYSRMEGVDPVQGA